MDVYRMNFHLMKSYRMDIYHTYVICYYRLADQYIFHFYLLTIFLPSASSSKTCT